MSGQLSFFSASVQPPSYDDLDGLLAAPGQVVRRAETARLSVVVADQWRVDAVLTGLEELGLVGQTTPTSGGEGLAVGTGFTAELLPLAQRWVRGAVKSPPAGFALDGPRLRWWCIAAGRHDAVGYVLGLGTGDELVWPATGAALAALGVPAAFIGPRAHGPAYRVVGARRLVRLRELVGDPPEQSPAGSWPLG
ncbi:MAG: hypothetical protein M3Z02_03905 [Actinomycetota bacterium]|nr:hypothetical protein [Actinomycetota bacterium]